MAGRRFQDLLPGRRIYHETRSRSLEAGTNHLLAEAAIHRDCAPARLTDQIARALRSVEPADDVCLLAARLHEDRASRAGA